MYRHSQVASRFAMDDASGFWLDYWYLLHQDDTHPLLAVRPLGLRSIASTVLGLDAASSDDERRKVKVLTRTTARDLNTYRGLAHLFDDPLPAAAPLNEGSKRVLCIARDWVEWAKRVEGEGSIDTLLKRLREAILVEVRSRRYGAVKFYTRRFAAEVSDDPAWTGRAMTWLADELLANESGNPLHDLDDLLRSATTLSTSTNRFSVQFHLAPVHITTRVVKAFQSLEVEGENDEKKATGMRFTVSASNPFSAAAVAEKLMSEDLDRLRLRF